MLTPEERIAEAEGRAAIEEQSRIEAERRSQLLAERLKALGMDPETLF